MIYAGCSVYDSMFPLIPFQSPNPCFNASADRLITLLSSDNMLVIFQCTFANEVEEASRHGNGWKLEHDNVWHFSWAGLHLSSSSKGRQKPPSDSPPLFHAETQGLLSTLSLLSGCLAKPFTCDWLSTPYSETLSVYKHKMDGGGAGPGCPMAWLCL